MNLDDEIRAGIVLNLIEGLGPIRLHQVVSAFGSAQQALNAGPGSWSAHIGDADFCAKLIGELPRLTEEADREQERCRKRGIQILSSRYGPYPALLKEIRLPPPILYAQGAVDWSPQEAIAIVGSRRCSYYGARTARVLARELAEMGIATVSGLARGIDSAVHDETLNSGGITLAVIGCGLDVCYPPENRPLFDQIVSKGAVLSEFPLGTHPLSGNFPRRNRIIAGLTRGTIVVEGTMKSGSLITAKIAAHEGRDVFAVPGPVTSTLSEAPHFLIREGATLVRRAADVIESLPEAVRAKLSSGAGRVLSGPPELSGPAGEVLRHLETEALSREELLQRVGLSADQAAQLLLHLELEGRIKTMPGGTLVRV